MGALMLAHGWALDVLRFIAAVYVVRFAWKSDRAAFAPADKDDGPNAVTTGRSYSRGLLIDLTNPKPTLVFRALIAVGLPLGTDADQLLIVLGALRFKSMVVLASLALLFLNARISEGYGKMRRGFEAVFAVFWISRYGYPVHFRAILLGTDAPNARAKQDSRLT